MTITPPESGGCGGFCRTCGTTHWLPPGAAMNEARLLKSRLEDQHHIDLFQTGGRADPDLSTDSLFGPQRGKMFGVLECLRDDGQRFFLYSFSGQYNGRWQVPGWAPPLFDVDRFQELNDPVEHRIKDLGRQLEQETDTSIKEDMRAARKRLSRQLMKQIHGLYLLHNFRAQTATLAEAVGPSTPLPTGIGDCCAPKMLNQAARLGLTPRSLVEFYFGRSNLSGTRQHGHFYSPCADKCKPLLGFLLCGSSAEPR